MENEQNKDSGDGAGDGSNGDESRDGDEHTVPSTIRGSYLVLRNKNSPAAQNELRSSAEQNKLRCKSFARDDAALMERKLQFQAAERNDAGKLKLSASSDAPEFYHTDHDRKQKLLSPSRAAS